MDEPETLSSRKQYSMPYCSCKDEVFRYEAREVNPRNRCRLSDMQPHLSRETWHTVILGLDYQTAEDIQVDVNSFLDVMKIPDLSSSSCY